MVQVVLSASACACPYRKAASTSTHDTRSKVNLQACAGGSEWWEESHHLRGQTALIHCISNVQVVTATVHQDKCEVGVTSWQVDLGRYNRAMQHTMVVLCACGTHTHACGCCHVHGLGLLCACPCCCYVLVAEVARTSSKFLSRWSTHCPWFFTGRMKLTLVLCRHCEEGGRLHSLKLFSSTGR